MMAELRGQRIGILISGGNIDLARYCGLTSVGELRVT
jgi:threonine dehydratase